VTVTFASSPAFSSFSRCRSSSPLALSLFLSLLLFPRRPEVALYGRAPFCTDMCLVFFFLFRPSLHHFLHPNDFRTKWLGRVSAPSIPFFPPLLIPVSHRRFSFFRFLHRVAEDRSCDTSVPVCDYSSHVSFSPPPVPLPSAVHVISSRPPSFQGRRPRAFFGRSSSLLPSSVYYTTL